MNRFSCLLIWPILIVSFACSTTPETADVQHSQQQDWKLASTIDYEPFIYTVHRSQRGFEGENEVQLIMQRNSRWLLSFIYRNAPRFDHFTNVEVYLDDAWVQLEGAEKPEPRFTHLHFPSAKAELDYRRIPQTSHYEYLVRRVDGYGGMASYILTPEQLEQLRAADRIRFRYWSEQRQRNYTFEMSGFTSALDQLSHTDPSDLDQRMDSIAWLAWADEQIIGLLISDILVRNHPGAHSGLRSWGTGADKVAAEKLLPALVDDAKSDEYPLLNEDRIEQWRSLIRVAGPRTIEALFETYWGLLKQGEDDLTENLERVITVLGARSLQQLLSVLTEKHSVLHCSKAVQLISQIVESDASAAARATPALLRLVDQRKGDTALRIQSAQAIQEIAEQNDLPNSDLVLSELQRIKDESGAESSDLDTHLQAAIEAIKSR